MLVKPVVVRCLLSRVCSVQAYIQNYSYSGVKHGFSEINGRGDPLCLPRDTLYPLKLALT
jgi:hypothetical protein